MKDREFINNLIKVNFSNAKEAHQATLDNAIVNRLNDIADKLEEQEKVLKIINEKNVNTAFLKMCQNLEKYNGGVPFIMELTEEEFNLLKRWLG